MVLGASSIWVINQPSDQPPPRRDSFPDSVSTAAILPTDVSALVDSAEVEERRGDWGRALSHLQRATRGNPRDARAALELARCFRWMHRYGELAIAANNAVALAPSSAARALAAAGEVERAVTILQRLTNGPSAISNASLRIDPAWTRLRADKRFAAMVGEPL